jgi:hypothetical protein
MFMTQSSAAQFAMLNCEVSSAPPARKLPQHAESLLEGQALLFRHDIPLEKP